jgi:hypothetical protein
LRNLRVLTTASPTPPTQNSCPSNSNAKGTTSGWPSGPTSGKLSPQLTAFFTSALIFCFLGRGQLLQRRMRSATWRLRRGSPRR